MDKRKEQDWMINAVHSLVEAQKAYFRTGATLDVDFRLGALRKLRKAVQNNEKAICDALTADLGRSYTEGYLCDVGMIVMEIDEIIHGLRCWAKPERHASGLVCFPSTGTRVYKMPYGSVLIISPFNFPFLLSLGVLAAALSGGNTAVLKVSSKSTGCSRLTAKIIAETFPPEYVTVVEGGHDVADLCLAEKFDKIFYTGSPRVARHVMEEAAKNLTPVALELGGETGNWCIVRKDANLRDAARKIAFFKLLNAGQICININQVAVAAEVAPRFVQLLKEEFTRQIGDDALTNAEYPCLISDSAYAKCAAEVEGLSDRVVFGGKGNPETRKYQPTIIYPADINEPVVNHELFCPILPVVEFNDSEVDALLDTISSREKPLAFYVFTGNGRWAKKVMSTMQYGGGCINEVCYHMVVKGVPFNGVGHSGMGAYHGVWGFREFTHPQTVLKGSSCMDLPLRYHPYEGRKNRWKLRLMRIFQR